MPVAFVPNLHAERLSCACGTDGLNRPEIDMRPDLDRVADLGEGVHVFDAVRADMVTLAAPCQFTFATERGQTEQDRHHGRCHIAVTAHPGGSRGEERTTTHGSCSAHSVQPGISLFACGRYRCSGGAVVWAGSRDRTAQQTTPRSRASVAEGLHSCARLVRTQLRVGDGAGIDTALGGVAFPGYLGRPEGSRGPAHSTLAVSPHGATEFFSQCVTERTKHA